MFTALFVACTLGTYGPEIERYARNEGLVSMLMRGEDQLRVGIWLSKALKPGGTVRTARLGGMSYEAPELTFWDDNGLTDREQALWISRGRVGGAAESPVSAREPDVVAALLVPESWSYTEDEDFVGWLEAGYSLVSRFPQGNYGEVHMWVAKSRQRDAVR
ncbi:MAG: hypothetical protein ACRD21_20810 [Vicinamibacteria bacterium]